ncbi:MAG: TonB-dependent receptor [Alphaproteobacteria bacterium]|nr:TonB-dependent receptor [Alphaproteobacteria bacterium]
MASENNQGGRALRFLTASTIALATLAGQSAFAQTAAPAAPAASSSTEDDIVVLGTRRTDRSVTNSASPVDVISAAELQGQATSNLIDTVRNTVPSFFVGQNTISDASTFVRSASLRGLPGDQVLVMMNGKRINRSALVQVYSGGDTALSYGSQAPDISVIPAIAIKNLQILRDGATSQYGSDAIAGVMNFGLKDDPSGVEVQVRYGQFYEGGTDEVNRQVAANWGFGLGDKGFVNLSAEYNDDDGTSRGATRPAAVLFAQANPTLAAQIPNYPGPAQIWGSSPSSGWKAVANSGYDVSANTKLYAFINAAKSEGDQSFNYRQVNTGSLPNANGVTVSLPNSNIAFRNTFYRTPCPANNATCPAGGFILDNNTFTFREFYPAGFTPRFVGENKAFLGVVGYKGELASGLTFDLSATSAENSLTLSMYNSLSPSYGPASQRSFKFGELTQKLENANLDLSYPIDVGFASPLTLSGGLEWRKETYESTAGDLQSYGAGPYATAQRLFAPTATPGVFTPATAPVGTVLNAQPPGASGYGGTSPATAGSWSQSNYAVYVDLETDLTDRLSGGVAARFEDYDTFGSTSVGKISALYKVSDALSLRGAVGSGFQAPSPGQSNAQILTTAFAAGNQVQTGTYPVGSAIAKYFGAQALKPADATNYGVGFILKPGATTTVTVDAYQIDVSDRIFITRNFTVGAGDVTAQPALAAVGVGGVVNYFTNGLDTTTKGLDIVGTHKADLFGGQATYTVAYNYNKNTVTRANANVISDAQRITIENLAPKHRATASMGWTLDKWTVNGRVNYYGRWRTEIEYPGQVFRAKATADLDVTYDVTDNYAVTLGAQNLFSEVPDKIAQSSSNNVFPLTGGLADGQIYPRSGGPFGINGGFWYVRLKAKY